MKFARKLTILFSVIVLTISLTVSYLVYNSEVSTLEGQIRDSMEDRAFNTIDKIDRMFFERYADLKLLATDKVITSRSSTPAEIQKRLVEFKSLTRSYTSLSFFDMRRNRIADTSGRAIDKTHPLVAYWKDITKGADFVMDVSPSVSLNERTFHFAHLVKDARGTPAGVVVSRLPVETLYGILEGMSGTARSAKDEGLKVDLVDRNGLILYSSYNPGAAFREVSQDWEKAKKFLAAGRTFGSEKHTHMVGGHEDEFYAFAVERGYNDFKGNGWVLIMNVPTKVAFSPAAVLRNRIIIITSVMSVLAFVAVAFFSRTVTRPLRQLSDASSEIGKGRLDTHVEVRTKGEIGFLAESFNRMADNLKSSRDEILSSREYISNILQSMQESLIVVTMEGIIRTANTATSSLLGYREEELKGRHISSIFDDGEGPLMGVDAGELLRRGFIVNVDRSYRKKDGTAIPVLFSASVMRDFEGGATGIVCVALDNTDQKRADLALRRSEERYRNLFEESKDIVFTGSLEGRVYDMNKSGLGFFGFRSKNEAFRADLSVHYRDRGDWDRFREEVKRSGFVRDFETVMRDSTGAEKTVSMTANAVDGEEGGALAYRSIMRDVTDQRRLERRLLQARKMEAIGEFTGKMAHDFKNILTVISSNSGILKSRIKGDETSEECVELVMSASKRATNLIQGLLAFSRNQDVALKPVNLNRVIGSVDKILSSVVGEKVELRFDLSADNPTVMADGGQIEQVLMNLAANAADAMPSGGVLSISTSLMRWDGQASRNGDHRPAEYALLTVSDTGVGMDEKTQERIFEPFFTTKEARKGTGLGLSIVYGIIDGCKGFINVHSEPGRGSTFQIFLPVAARAEDPAQEPAAAPAAFSGTETILFAEDDPEVRKTVRFIFEENGYRVLEAADGAEAVRMFSERGEAVGVLVLDVRMPGKNGREAYEEIKKMSPGIKAVFISAYTEDIIDRRWIAAGKLGFVLKPFAHDELLREVRRMLDRDA